MAIRESALKQVENKLLEKGIDMSTFQVKKEQTESQIEKINEKISELPELKEKLIAQYQTEKEEKTQKLQSCGFCE